MLFFLLFLALMKLIFCAHGVNGPYKPCTLLLAKVTAWM